jgi:hypothetical protein
MGFYILPRADDKEASTYQEKRYVQNVEKYLSKKHNVPRHGLGGSRHEKRREESLKHKSYRKNIARDSICGRYIYIFEPIPEIFWL